MTTSERLFDLAVPPHLSGRRLDGALAELCSDYSRTALKSFIERGQLRLNGVEIVKPRHPVFSGDRLELRVAETIEEHAPAEDLPFALSYEDDDVLVVDKPAGLVVHPGAGNPRHTLVNGLLFRFPELASLPRAGLVHRLDKDTSGLLLVARTQVAYHRLTEQMAARAIERIYAAIVQGIPTGDGSIEAPIGRDRVQRTKMRVTHRGRAAATHYRVVTRFREHAQLELKLETGRTHQIRVHLQHLGYPLVGDPAYGTAQRRLASFSPTLQSLLSNASRQALHAKRLTFSHPDSGDEIKVRSALPSDLARLVRLLRDDARRHAGHGN